MQTERPLLDFARLSPEGLSVADSGMANPGETAGARRLTAAEVRWTCDPADLPFASTAELSPPDALIGQERAERSLEFGVDIRSRGFNIYAAGTPGTGRTSMVMAQLQAEAARRPTPDDWCYVHNFADSRRPRALRLPAGQAPTYRARLQDIVETLSHELQRAFDTEQYQRQRDALTQAVQTERREAFGDFEERAAAAGFALTQSPVGLSVTPFDTFYTAEGYHQEFYRRNPHQPYCFVIIDPKMKKFRKDMPDMLKAAK